MGAGSSLQRQRHIAPVFDEHRVAVTQADDEMVDPSGRDSMGYWGEKTALYAPIIGNDELLGVVELVERRQRRDFSEADLRLVMGLAEVPGDRATTVTIDLDADSPPEAGAAGGAPTEATDADGTRLVIPLLSARRAPSTPPG